MVYLVGNNQTYRCVVKWLAVDDHTTVGVAVHNLPPTVWVELRGTWGTISERAQSHYVGCVSAVYSQMGVM